MSFLYLLKEVKMKAKNKPCSFTLPLQIPQLKGKKTRISLTTENTIISSLQKQQNPKKHPTKQNQTKNPQRKPASNSPERCFVASCQGLRTGCTGKYVCEQHNMVMLNFMPISHRLTGLQSSEAGQQTAHLWQFL